VPLDDEVETQLEELVVGRVRVRVRERVACCRELLGEPAGHGDVEAAEIGRHGLDLGPHRGWLH
jgi:hypothetical protein